MWDFNALREIIDTLPGNSILQNKALVTANAIMNAFEMGGGDNIQEMRTIAEDVFGKGWQAKGADIYGEGPKKAQVVGISYCHIVRPPTRTGTRTEWGVLGHSLVMAVLGDSAKDGPVLVDPD